MMIKADETGRIVVIQSDPSEQSVIDNLVNNYGYIYIPPIKSDPIQVTDADGNPVYDEDGELMTVFNVTPPDVTHDRHMFDHATGTVVERPVMPEIASPVTIKADGKDSVTIPCGIIRFDGETHEIPDGKIVFTATDPGKYVFESVFPYVEGWRLEVIAQ